MLKYPMTWHYQIVKFKHTPSPKIGERTYYALVRCYEDVIEEGDVAHDSIEAAEWYESKKELMAELELKLKDARHYDVIDREAE